MKSTQCLFFLSLILFSAVFASAQEHNTEIQGFYQTYRDFSFETGLGDPYDIDATKLNGGGFTIAQDLAPWFAFWTQFTFYGSAESPVFSARMFNNLYGIRYQTEQHGPFRVYAKAGLGYSNFSMNDGQISFGMTKFSVAYGAGAQIWMSENYGVVFEATHNVNGLPQLSNSVDREKWDSGLTLSAGFAVRF
jgi:hypothetical protein